MKYITKEDENDLQPSKIDIKLAEAKGLAENESLNEDYFLLQSIYLSLLEQYIAKHVNIKQVENELDNNGFLSVEDSEKDIYQYISNNRYFYIRNTIYVEKLPKDIMRILLSLKQVILDEELEKIIKNTYKILITTDDFNMEDFNINYGPLSEEYIKPNGNLIIGFRLKEEDDSLYPSEDEWFEDYCRRREYISNILPIVEEEISKRLGIDCSVIEYFEESIKKKNNSNYLK